MPREARKKSATRIYHVVIKGNDRQIIFESNSDFHKYIDILELYKEECHFRLFAYCLMSNHIHLIVQVTDTPLETIFRKINTHYAGWFNMKYQRSGHVQDGRFYSEPIENLSYLKNAINYVHSNPSKAGLERIPGDSYKWSSIYEYKSDANALVDTNFIYAIFSWDELAESASDNSHPEFIDIDNIRKRLPDDVAKEIIFKLCACSSISDFSSLSLKLRNKYIYELHKSGISTRQLNRLTGVSRGVIEKIIKK